MTERFQRAKDLPVEHLLAAGTPLCSGCGGLHALKGIYDVLGKHTVIVNAAGCMTPLATYPFTPFRAASTATSFDPPGYRGFKKDLFAIWAAHRPAYVATVCASEPLDLARKLERAKQLHGPRLILALAPCPTGWDFDPAESMSIGKLAVQTGIWPLKEYADGRIVHTKVMHPRRPVEDYLGRQGRFRHLFQPQREESTLTQIQAEN